MTEIDIFENYKYELELNEYSPRIDQNTKLITIQLKPHQLACLTKAKIMEQYGNLYYNIDKNKHNDIFNTGLDGEYKINTNIGILGDIVGYGKTLTALGIVSSCELDDIYLNKLSIKSYISNNNYSYFSYSTNNTNIKKNRNIIDSSLIIVPRGPVYMQWIKTLKNDTNLKYLAISDLNFIKKNLPNPESEDFTNEMIYEYFSKYDVVLIKNTTFDVLLKYYNTNGNYYYSSSFNILTRWKRIMIDEAHDLVKLIPLLHYYYLWLISGTYEDLYNSIRSHNSLLYDVRQIFNDIKNIKLMLIKCNKDFVRSSFKLPIPIEKFYLCKMSYQYLAIKDFVTNSIIEKLNANDVSGAIRELGGKTESEDNMIELLTQEINNDIDNKKKELDYVRVLSIPEEIKQNKINKLNNEITQLENKLLNLKTRISELSSKICSICMDVLDKPFILKCTHSFCGICLINWIKKNNNCPECRNYVNTEDLIGIDNEKKRLDIENEEQSILSKNQTLINIIKKKINGKFLVFSQYENGFNNIINELKNNNISYAELKGNTSHMMNVLNDFRNLKIKVILLNTYYAGSGIDISFATDVIIYHQMGLYKHQAVGRAQRVGRIDKLTIHNLCYEQEL
jgi:hypothetical protein